MLLFQIDLTNPQNFYHWILPSQPEIVYNTALDYKVEAIYVQIIWEYTIASTLYSYAALYTTSGWLGD